MGFLFSKPCFLSGWQISTVTVWHKYRSGACSWYPAWQHERRSVRWIWRSGALRQRHVWQNIFSFSLSLSTFHGKSMKRRQSINSITIDPLNVTRVLKLHLAPRGGLVIGAFCISESKQCKKAVLVIINRYIWHLRSQCHLQWAWSNFPYTYPILGYLDMCYLCSLCILLWNYCTTQLP